MCVSGSAEGHRAHSESLVVNNGNIPRNDELYEQPIAGDKLSLATLSYSSSAPVQTRKLYARRWFIVILFASYSMTNSYQWIHLNIIFDKITLFYNESLPTSQYGKDVAIDWLSMIYMLSYIPLILPTSWLLDRTGLRVVAIIGTLLNALGAWIKCAAVRSDLFTVLMFAQTICAVAQVFILGIPARLAAVWFGPNEVSTATAIGVFGNQVSVTALLQ